MKRNHFIPKSLSFSTSLLSLEWLYLSASCTPPLAQDLTTYFEFSLFQKTASK